MPEFKPGDLVRVKDDQFKSDAELSIDYIPNGYLGYVVTNDHTQEYPIKVRLIGTNDEEWFYEQELEQADE